MKTRPILYCAPMVRAQLDGRKTQTRRLPKLVRDLASEHLEDLEIRGHTAFDLGDGLWAVAPYQVGDLLWVREAFSWSGFEELAISTKYRRCPNRQARDNLAIYRASGENQRAEGHPAHGKTIWRPSIHMPRTVSRITNEVTALKVERLQDISEADAIAEGVFPVEMRHGKVTAWAAHDDDAWENSYCRARDAYGALWDSVNKPGERWEDNPWVAVTAFKIHICNVDELIARRAA